CARQSGGSWNGADFDYW
nr:immunoglobulin heavy chain junction region [Macaca mulatta]MOW33613.1 immunoglobulin heavy chain junction region [Macaca mulatta]